MTHPLGAAPGLSSLIQRCPATSSDQTAILQHSVEGWTVGPVPACPAVRRGGSRLPRPWDRLGDHARQPAREPESELRVRRVQQQPGRFRARQVCRMSRESGRPVRDPVVRQRNEVFPCLDVPSFYRMMEHRTGHVAATGDCASQCLGTEGAVAKGGDEALETGTAAGHDRNPAVPRCMNSRREDTPPTRT